MGAIERMDQLEAKTTAPPRRGVHVRLARDSQDVGAVIELGRLYLAEVQVAHNLPYDENDQFTIGMQALANGNPAGLLAWQDDRLVGLAVVAVGEQFFSSSLAATVQLLYVRPDARGGSAAVKLLQAVCQWSSAVGADSVHVHVSSAIRPERTDRFLRKMGFRQTGGNYLLAGVA